MKKYISLFALSSIIALSTGGVANAQEIQPLSVNEQTIVQQTQELQEKSTKLDAEAQEIEELKKKKTELLTTLEKEKLLIAELKEKIAAKKERERLAAEAARQAAVQPAQPTYSQPVARVSYDSSGNLYSYGYCTWYVKNRRPDLPNNLGNANTWYYRAQSMGLPTSTTPRAGAVGTTERGALGHVVYVESVNGDGTINISEMNAPTWGAVSYRTANASEFRYILP